ncbi:response regulator [Kordiimonas gwangyangensis]|uniref:response regulator n=1 Tax=Kordiimonas gwangyangensis TaxID=288022 RepID=UPI00046EA708|nr:response regulator [Kordiimonas gwangyangensis]
MPENTRKEPIPAENAETEANNTVENSGEAQDVDTVEAGGAPSKYILVVEDNPVMSSIIGKLLSRFDVGYDFAKNGKEAIAAASNADYDLILMDIMMPKMGGVTATREIRKISEHYENAPIIAVTARVSDRDVEEYLAEGMSGVIKKPINKVNLSGVLLEFLDLGEETGDTGAETASDIYDEDDLDALNWETFNEYRALLGDKFAGFLKDYLTAGPDMLAEISSVVMEDDASQIQFLAHKLKSTAQVFGADSVADLAARLEIMGKHGDTLQAPAVFNELHIAYERTQRVLRKKYVIMQNMANA